MAELQASGLAQVVLEAARSKPLLGVCLGMQALLDASEENQGIACLGIIPGRVARFSPDLKADDGGRLKIPHMGWNQVIRRRAHPLWRNIPDGSRFYFVHSYYAIPVKIPPLPRSPYGTDFASVILHDNVFAVQFHPEKSQHAGLGLLSNFVAWDGES
jgi:glutamine amidotransferase